MKRWEPNIEAIMSLTKEDRAWIAGFFDGEGSVMLSKTDAGMACKVSVSQKRPAVLQWLHSVFGGSMRHFARKTLRGLDSEAGEWALHGHTGPKVFLKIIRPYTRVKSEEIDVALSLLSNDNPSEIEIMESIEQLRAFRTHAVLTN
jgi:hypothetical protein